MARPGANHQAAHCDFRRGLTTHDTHLDRLPPRLVTFLYLQDTPTLRHGPTIFLPGTNTAAAHERFYSSEGAGDATAVAATLNAGDAVVYDASVLHFGSANRCG